jgi:hypothetical protein
MPEPQKPVQGYIMSEAYRDRRAPPEALEPWRVKINGVVLSTKTEHYPFGAVYTERTFPSFDAANRARIAEVLKLEADRALAAAAS